MKLTGSTINAGHAVSAVKGFSGFTHSLTLLPADPQVAPGEKASDGVSGEVVNPALLPQLSHDGVDEWESCSRLEGDIGCTEGRRVNYHFTELELLQSTTAVRTRHLSPRSQVLCVFVPVHLSARRVALHLVKVGDPKTGCVEELSPEQLAVEGHGRVRVLPLQHKQS